MAHAVNTANVSDLVDLEGREKRLTDELKTSYDKDLEKDSNILHELGKVYYEKGKITKNLFDFTKSAALNNSALIRTKNQNQKNTIEDYIRQNEHQVLAVISGKEHSLNELPASSSDDHKTALSEIRSKIKTQTSILWEDIKNNYSIDMENEERTKKEQKLNENIQNLFKFIKTEMKTFVRKLLSKVYEILGRPPVKYAILELGSWARQELTPYSDLEFAILVENEAETTKQYFRKLTHLLHIYVINLGETPLPAIAIKTLNDFDGHDDWFYDSVTCNGLCFDGSMPWACKTPLGRPDREIDGDTRPGIELIMTPGNMAKIQNEVLAVKEGYHLADILATFDLLDGDHSLLDIYTQAIQTETTEERKLMSKLTFLNDIETYEAKSKVFIKNEKTALSKVKSELYRLPTLIAGNLKICLELSGKTPWKICSDLEHITALSATGCQNMQFTISLVSILRLQTYLQNEGQKEVMSAYPKFEAAPVSDENTNIFYLDNLEVIFRLYFTIVPMTEFFRTLLFNKIFPDAVTEQEASENLYADNETVRAMLYFKLMQYEKARKCWSQVTNADNTNLATSLQYLAFISEEQGNFPQALEYRLQCKTIMKQLHGDKVLPDMVGLLNNIGNTYQKLGDYHEALIYHLQSEELWKQLHEDSVHPDIAVSLNNIGNTYELLGKHHEALDCHLRSRDMKKQLYGDSAHLDIADSLDNIGNTYLSLGNYHESLKFFLHCKDMRKRLYGGCAHPAIAASLKNIGNAYQLLGNYEEALNCYFQNENMNKQLLGDIAHPHIAGILGNIGAGFQSLGNYHAALKYFLQSKDMSKQLHGDNAHPGMAVSLSNIGYTYQSIGDHHEALKNYLHSEAMMKVLYGDSANPDMASLLSNIGSFYQTLGKYNEALKYHLQCKDIRKQLYGNSAHPKMAYTLTHIGNTYRSLGKYSESLKYHLQSKDMVKQLYGDNAHPDMAALLCNIGNTVSSLGNYSESLEYHIQGKNMIKELYGNAPHPDMAASLNNIGNIYRYLGNHHEALKYYLQSNYMKRQLYGYSAHRDVASSLHNIGTTYKLLGNSEGALKYLLLYKDMQRDLYGESSIQMVHSLLKLFSLYFENNDFEKCIQCSTKACSISKAIPGEIFYEGRNCEYFTLDSLMKSGACYGMMGKYDKAIAVTIEGLEIGHTYITGQGDIQYKKILSTGRDFLKNACQELLKVAVQHYMDLYKIFYPE